MRIPTGLAAGRAAWSPRLGQSGAWVGLAFHAFALLGVYGGYSALRRERTRAAAPSASLAEAA